MLMNFLLVFLSCFVVLSPKEGDLNQAVRTAREERRLHKVSEQDTLFITLLDGRYRLTEPLLLRPEDSGTKQGPTVIRAAHPGKAVLDGGLELQGWRRPSAKELQGVPASVHDQVWVCDAPRVNGRIVETRQLWQGDKRLPMASMAPKGKLFPMKDFRKVEREIWVEATPAIQQLARSLRDGQGRFTPTMLVHQRWAIALLRIRQIQIQNEIARISFMEPESRREFEHPWPQPVINDTLEDGRVVSSSFDVMGDVSLLDKPGEWVQSYPDGLIYYVSDDKGGARPSLPITIPVLEQLIQIVGSLERPVHDILLDGIRFEHTAWTTPNREGWVTLQAGFPIIDAYKLQEPGLPEKATLENQAWIGRPQSAITVKGGKRINFERCEFLQLGACGLDYTEACSDCYVNGCRFEDMGGTALLVGHFPSVGFETHVPFRPNVLEDLCHDIQIAHNQVHHVGMEDWGACAINAGYVFNTTIADNEVSDCKWSGICVGWGWTRLDSGMKSNHILRNRVIDFGMQLHDCGAIYTLSNQPKSSIIGNRIGIMGEAPYATNNRAFYIYLDEATDGFTIQDNEMPAPLIGTNQLGAHVKSDVKLQ